MRYYKNVNIDTNDWINILLDESITTKEVLDVLVFLVDSEEKGVVSSYVSKKLGYTHHVSLNKLIGKYGARINKLKNVLPPFYTPEEPNYWNIPLLGYRGKDKYFYWVLRPELKAALLKINNVQIKLPVDRFLEEQNNLKEGGVKQTFFDKHERNAKARKFCIKHYGYSCAVCGLNLEAIYGVAGREKIHVHHLIPLYFKQEEYIIDPIKDLRPVCPNCHYIIHSKKEPYSIQEVKDMLNH